MLIYDRKNSNGGFFMYGPGAGFTNWLCDVGGFMPGHLGVIFWLIVLGLIIALINMIYRYFFPSQTPDGTASTPNALTILKNRYASGEISKIEFEQIKKDIA